MIICCGEALVDMLPEQGDYRPVLGGSIFNTARAAARLGLKTAFVSSVSTDPFGDSIVAALRESGVDTSFVHRVHRPTALAFVTLTNGQAEYRFEEAGSASSMITSNELPATVPNCELAHFGSISLVTEPCATALYKFARSVSQETLIAVDPNIRPAFITDASAHKARLEELISFTDILKLSEEDLAWFGIDAGEDEANFAARCLSGRTSVVVITRGAEGVTGFCTSGRVDVPAQNVKVVDTVGAGDAFSAGFYAGLSALGWLERNRLVELSPDELEGALRRGVDTSAAVVQQAGAELPR